VPQVFGSFQHSRYVQALTADLFRQGGDLRGLDAGDDLEAVVDDALADSLRLPRDTEERQ
jgi:hypothetical protein